MNEIHILRSGLCSTVQDRGRAGFRHIGVPLGGALDSMAHELANRLVGNSVDAAAIEMTLTGDEIKFTHDTLIAITGADMAPTLHDSSDLSQPVAQPEVLDPRFGVPLGNLTSRTRRGTVRCQRHSRAPRR